MTNGRKNVEIESQAVGKAPHQGVQPSGLVPAAFKTTTTTLIPYLPIEICGLAATDRRCKICTI